MTGRNDSGCRCRKERRGERGAEFTFTFTVATYNLFLSRPPLTAPKIMPVVLHGGPLECWSPFIPEHADGVDATCHCTVERADGRTAFFTRYDVHEFGLPIECFALNDAALHMSESFAQDYSFDLSISSAVEPRLQLTAGSREEAVSWIKALVSAGVTRSDELDDEFGISPPLCPELFPASASADPAGNLARGVCYVVFCPLVAAFMLTVSTWRGLHVACRWCSKIRCNPLSCCHNCCGCLGATCQGLLHRCGTCLSCVLNALCLCLSCHCLRRCSSCSLAPCCCCSRPCSNPCTSSCAQPQCTTCANARGSCCTHGRCSPCAALKAVGMGVGAILIAPFGLLFAALRLCFQCTHRGFTAGRNCVSSGGTKCCQNAQITCAGLCTGLTSCLRCCNMDACKVRLSTCCTTSCAQPCVNAWGSCCTRGRCSPWAALKAVGMGVGAILIAPFGLLFAALRLCFQAFNPCCRYCSTAGCKAWLSGCSMTACKAQLSTCCRCSCSQLIGRVTGVSQSVVPACTSLGSCLLGLLRKLTATPCRCLTATWDVLARICSLCPCLSKRPGGLGSRSASTRVSPASSKSLASSKSPASSKPSTRSTPMRCAAVAGTSGAGASSAMRPACTAPRSTTSVGGGKGSARLPPPARPPAPPRPVAGRGRGTGTPGRRPDQELL